MADMTARADIVALQAQVKVITGFLSRIHPEQWSGTAPTVTDADAEVEAVRRVLLSFRMTDTPSGLLDRTPEQIASLALEAAARARQEKP